MPLQMQPRSWFAFSATVALCWLMLSLLSARTPRSLAARCSPGTQILPCDPWLLCPRCSTLTCSYASCQPPLPAASEEDSPLTSWPCLPAECPQQTAQRLLSVMSEFSTSHILPNTWMSPQSLCLLCSPVQKLSLAVDGLDWAGHPGCHGSLLELHMTAAALHWVQQGGLNGNADHYWNFISIPYVIINWIKNIKFSSFQVEEDTYSLRSSSSIPSVLLFTWLWIFLPSDLPDPQEYATDSHRSRHCS